VENDAPDCCQAERAVHCNTMPKHQSGPSFHSDRFGTSPPLIGMVHVGALPGTPRSQRGMAALAHAAAAEAKVLVRAGFRGLLIENMHDAPYVIGPHDPAITAAMTLAALRVREVAPDVLLGVQILARGEREALGVCLAADGQFVRCENFVFAHVADEGMMIDAAAGPLLRYRRRVGAAEVAVLADIKKKHASHAVTMDISIEDAVYGAGFFGADGVIITGAATGRAANISDVRAAGKGGLPVLVGSGVTAKNVRNMLRYAQAAIVGSSLKVGGLWSAELDAGACTAIVAAAR